jgi:hypothetical protein
MDINPYVNFRVGMRRTDAVERNASAAVALPTSILRRHLHTVGARLRREDGGRADWWR